MAAIDPAEKKRLFERLSSVREIVFGVQTAAGYLIGLAISPLGATAG